MGINKVDQKSFGYKLIFSILKLWHSFYYYHKIEISHNERVPKKGAIIFTPNHQNALNDALALLFSTNKTLVFLARADIFKIKILAEILYYFRMLPVFRPRDGHSEVKKNQDTFDKTTEVLQKNLGLAIFPEGNHGDQHHLRSLKKGFARIAYQTEEGNDYQLDIKILPVGIHYSNYHNRHSILSIVYGHPFSLSEFYEDYKANPAIAYNKASEKLSEEMKKYMVHIENDQYYETIDFLQSVYAPEILGSDYINYTNKIESSKKAVSKIQEFKEVHRFDFWNLHQETSNFLVDAKSLNFEAKELLIRWKTKLFMLQCLIAIILSPLIIISHIITIIPAVFSNLVTIPIKDLQFKSTIKFVASLVLFILFFVIELIIYNSTIAYPWYYFLIIYLLSIFFLARTGAWQRRLFNRIKLQFLKLFKPKHILDLQMNISKIETHILNISQK